MVGVAVGVAVGVVVGVAVGVVVVVGVAVGVAVVVAVVVAVGVAVVVAVVVVVAVGVGVVVAVGRKRMIDWTLPVETTEDPPRPVRVLATDNDNMRYKIVFALGGGIGMADYMDGWEEHRRFQLRNVSPPKPEPVLREAWVVWDADGAVLVFTDETSARLHGGVYARAAVMSDGSPVPASPEQFDQMREMAKLIQDRDHWKAKTEALQAEVDRLNHDVESLQAEVERMKPVVDAAVIWVKFETVLRSPSEAVLFEAVRTYQSQQAPAESVKNCTTCRWDQADHPCSGCRDNDFWDPRHD